MASFQTRVVDMACKSAVRQISAISLPVSMARPTATDGVASRRSSSRVFSCFWSAGESGTVRMASFSSTRLNGSRIAVVTTLKTVWTMAMPKVLAVSAKKLNPISAFRP